MIDGRNIFFGTQMSSPEFDDVAAVYAGQHAKSIAASGESPDFFARYKARDACQAARRAGLTVRSMLDFGCGIGNTLPHFAEFLPAAAITCCDVSARSIELSQARFPHIAARYATICGQSLPFHSAAFDLCFSACVFHHIPAHQHVLWLRELRRVSRANGMLVLFEHNPFNPLTVAAVRRCPFDADAILIRASELARRARAAGWHQPKVIFRMFFPHALRFARPLERWLGPVPFGAQYLIAARSA
jgi:SAM-dependent methyltransferase